MYKQKVILSKAVIQSTARKDSVSNNGRGRPVVNSNLAQTRKNIGVNKKKESNISQGQGNVSNFRTTNSQIRPVTQSNLDKYNKGAYRSRVITSSTSPYHRAPANQFKRYLSDAQNVFWENSPIVRQVKLCEYIKFCLTFLLFFLIVTYFFIGRIQAWPKSQCPHNAECGVFIHCFKGYVLEGNRCIIDPALKFKAQSISLATVDQLKLEYGNSQCMPQRNATVPQKRIRHVLQEFQIDDPLLKEEIYQYFQNRQNQIDNNFVTKAMTVSPTEKLYSFSCRVQLFTESKSFYWLIVIVVVGSMIAGNLFKWLQFKRKAQLSYQYLRDKTLREESILIEEHKGEVIKIAGQWTGQLWSEIDRLRFEQRLIVYYQQHDQLYWKSFQQCQ